MVQHCHVGSFGALTTLGSMLSMLHLIAVAYQARYPEAVAQRIGTLAEIDEEHDLFE